MGKRVKRISVTMPEDEIRAMEAEAERIGLSFAAFARVLLLRAFEEIDKKPAGVASVLRAIEEPARGNVAAAVQFRAAKPRKSAAKPEAKQPRKRGK